MEGAWGKKVQALLICRGFLLYWVTGRNEISGTDLAQMILLFRQLKKEIILLSPTPLYKHTHTQLYVYVCVC